jgi:hypothetical protein
MPDGASRSPAAERETTMSPNPVRVVLDPWQEDVPGQTSAPHIRFASDETAVTIETDATSPAPAPAPATLAPTCPYCTEVLPPGARQCPLCLKALAGPAQYRPAPVATFTPSMSVAPPAPAPPRAPQPTVTSPAPAAAATVDHDAGALYKLEAPARCPECAQHISTIRVLRTIRVQVSFTSTLPRKGYVILCPECGGMLSAALAGVI